MKTLRLEEVINLLTGINEGCIPQVKNSPYKTDVREALSALVKYMAKEEMSEDEEQLVTVMIKL